jgi:hypothetical protein
VLSCFDAISGAVCPARPHQEGRAEQADADPTALSQPSRADFEAHPRVSKKGELSQSVISFGKTFVDPWQKNQPDLA